MTGITLAALDRRRTNPAALPGIPVEDVREPVFFLADVTVRAWIAGRRAAGRRVIIADDSWHPGPSELPGENLLSFPAIERIRLRRAEEFLMHGNSPAAGQEA